MRKSWDPVCRMTIDSAEAADSTEYNGETLYFCSKGCSAKFSADPEANIAPGKDTNDGHSAGQHAAAAPEHAGSQTTNTSEMEYTCPMHPQIVQIGPGSCPISGMALEPRVVSLDVPEDTAELDDMKRRFWVSLVLTLPIFLLETVGMFVRTDQFLSTTVNVRGLRSRMSALTCSRL